MKQGDPGRATPKAKIGETRKTTATHGAIRQGSLTTIVLYLPQIGHRRNRFSRQGGHCNFDPARDAMEKLRQNFSSTKQQDSEVAAALGYSIAAQGLRYSSPLPWILALAIGITMWALLAWLIWRSIG
jgi:hypothetical protein